MVYNKVRNRLVIFGIIAICLLVFGIASKTPIETNIVKTILPAQIMETSDMAEVSDKTSSLIKVALESDSYEELLILEGKFLDSLDRKYFEIIDPKYSEAFSFYMNNPRNFLSYKTRELLKSGNYKALREKSIQELYNPVGLHITNFNDDPYMLLSDFLQSNQVKTNNYFEYNNTYYTSRNIKIKNYSNLSTKEKQKRVQSLIKLQKELPFESCQVHITGTAIHTYHTSKDAAVSINIICILSTLLIAVLTYLYFKNITLLLPIALSIMFGLLTGFTVTRLWFDQFHTLTLVFGTTLIGIGIDYSYHYLFAENHDKNFFKNITMGMLTTTGAFALLYPTNISILQQISVFIVSGLLAIYWFIVCIYPVLNLKVTKTSYYFNLNKKIRTGFLILVLIVAIAGYFKFSFNDSLSVFYKPKGKLLRAEQLIKRLEKTANVKTKFVFVKFNSYEDMLEKEEIVTDILNKKGLKYYSISKYIPSVKRQQENINLVKNLYQYNLDTFNNILTAEQVTNLKNSTSTPVKIDLDKTICLKDFILNDNTSLIFVETNAPLNIKVKDCKTVDIYEDISDFLEQYRHIMLLVLPLAFFITFLLLGFIYGFKNSVKMMIPPTFASFATLGIVSLIGETVNVFSLISLLLVLGFTIDYSIFRLAGDKKASDAIFVSCLTTSFSFFALSFTNFKFISSLSLIIFLGIIISYITGLFLFSQERAQQ